MTDSSTDLVDKSLSTLIILACFNFVFVIVLLGLNVWAFIHNSEDRTIIRVVIPFTFQRLTEVNHKVDNLKQMIESLPPNYGGPIHSAFDQVLRQHQNTGLRARANLHDRDQ